MHTLFTFAQPAATQSDLTEEEAGIVMCIRRWGPSFSAERRTLYFLMELIKTLDKSTGSLCLRVRPASRSHSWSRT